MFRPSLLTSIAAALVLALCGCPDSAEVQEAAERDAAWKIHELALIELSEGIPKVASDAAGQAPLTESRWEVSEPLDCRSESEGHNTLVVQVEDLGENQPTYLLNLGNRGTLLALEKVRAGEVPTSIHDMATTAGLRYALLVRVREVKGPFLPDGDISKLDGGYVRGDVLLYDVKDTTCKGGFPFEGTSSEAVQAGVDDPDAWLQDDLFRRTRRAIHDQIEALGSGNQGPLGSDDRLR